MAPSGACLENCDLLGVSGLFENRVNVFLKINKTLFNIKIVMNKYYSQWI